MFVIECGKTHCNQPSLDMPRRLIKKTTTLFYTGDYYFV